MARSIGALLLVLILSLVVLVFVVFYQAKRAPQGRAEYVALGSSFAAGPGVGERAQMSPTLCMRSSTDYPALVAKSLGLSLTDVSCSGATALHVLYGKQFFLPAQIDALRPDTRLVTVTVGGNDLAFLGNTFAWTCQNDRDRTPMLWRMGVCGGVGSRAEVDTAMTTLPDRFRRIAEEVRRRSPHATLVFVDYLTFLPEVGACYERLPLTKSQLERARFIERRLAEMTATAARRNGALLVQASQLSKGHDICSANPWVFGLPFPKAMFNWAPMPFHPNQQGMDAIAAAINRSVRSAQNAEPASTGATSRRSRSTQLQS